MARDLEKMGTGLRKMKLALLLTIVILFCLSLTGCAKLKLLEASNEKQVEEDIIKFIKENYGDTVTAEYVSKEPLEVATTSLDGPGGYMEVPGGYVYHYIVTPSQYPDLKIEVSYNDGYILKKMTKKEVKQAYIYSLYEFDVENYLFGIDLANKVHEYDSEAYVYKISKLPGSGQFIVVVYRDDFETVCDIHNEIAKMVNGDKGSYKTGKVVGVFYSPDSYIDFSNVETMQFPGFGGHGDDDVIEALDLGNADRFAQLAGENVEDMAEFFNSRANMEDTWFVATQEDDPSNHVRMRTDYENYRNILFFEAIERDRVTWRAWGIY